MNSCPVKVSVIVPVYNSEQFLQKCLESLVNQTLKEIEVICINDGSTDNSLNILENYASKDNRIKIITTSNKGQSAARNIGIKKATGEYVGFVDADDWIDLNFFETLYNSTNHIVEVACGNILGHYPDKTHEIIKYKKQIVYVEKNEKIEIAGIPQHNYIWNKIYKTETLKNLNINFEEGRYYEDVIWSIQALDKLSNLVTVPNTFYHYNKKNSNSTTTALQTNKHITDGIYARTKIYKYAEEQGIKLNIHSKIYINLFGIRLLKILNNIIKTEFKLFGFLPFITIYKK